MLAFETLGFILSLRTVLLILLPCIQYNMIDGQGSIEITMSYLAIVYLFVTRCMNLCSGACKTSATEVNQLDYNNLFIFVVIYIQCSPLNSNPLKTNFRLIQILSDSLHRANT